MAEESLSSNFGCIHFIHLTNSSIEKVTFIKWTACQPLNYQYVHFSSLVVKIRCHVEQNARRSNLRSLYKIMTMRCEVFFSPMQFNCVHLWMASSSVWVGDMCSLNRNWAVLIEHCMEISSPSQQISGFEGHNVTRFYSGLDKYKARSYVFFLFGCSASQFACNSASADVRQEKLHMNDYFRIQSDCHLIITCWYQNSTYWNCVSSLIDADFKLASFKILMELTICTFLLGVCHLPWLTTKYWITLLETRIDHKDLYDII